MRWVVKNIGRLGIVIALIIAHIGVRYALPEILSTVNVILLFGVVRIVYTSKSTTIWYVIIAYLFIDLWAGHPVGTITIVATLAVLGVIWAQRIVFTGNRWQRILALMPLCILLLRLMHIAVIWLSQILSGGRLDNLRSFLVISLLELLTTTAVAITIHVMHSFWERIQAQKRRFAGL